MKQSQVKNTKTEMKNKLEGSTADQRMQKNESTIQGTGQQKSPNRNNKKKKEFLKKNSLKDFRDKIKQYSNDRVSEGEEREEGAENVFEKKMIITENSPNLGKEINKAKFRSKNQRRIQGSHTDGQWAHEKMLNITNHQGNASQNPMRYHLIPLAVIKKTKSCW